MLKLIFKLCCLMFFAPVIIFVVALVLFFKAAKIFLTVIIPTLTRFIILAVSAAVTFALTIYAFRRKTQLDGDALDFLESLLPPTENQRRKNFSLLLKDLTESIYAEILSTFNREKQKIEDFFTRLYHHDF